MPFYRRFLPTFCMRLKAAILLGKLISAVFIQHPVGRLKTLALKSYLVDRLGHGQEQCTGGLALPF